MSAVIVRRFTPAPRKEFSEVAPQLSTDKLRSLLAEARALDEAGAKFHVDGVLVVAYRGQLAAELEARGVQTTSATFAGHAAERLDREFNAGLEWVNEPTNFSSWWEPAEPVGDVIARAKQVSQ